MKYAASKEHVEQISELSSTVNVALKTLDGRNESVDTCVAGSAFTVGKSPPQNGISAFEGNSGAGGLGEGTPKVSNAFAEGRTSLEEYVHSLKTATGVPILIEAVGIGKGKEDLTNLSTEPTKNNQVFPVQPEHQQLIVDNGALPHLVDLLKRHKDGSIRRAADAITNLAQESSSIKTRVRLEGGIPPLVELLEFIDPKVQMAAAGALRTLAFKNDENKNQIVECNALHTLILMLRSEDAAIHYEAVGVIGNLVHSSPNIKKEVLVAGALQPVIGLLSSWCSESRREAALLFAATDSDCKGSDAFLVWPLLQSPRHWAPICFVVMQPEVFIFEIGFFYDVFV
ncbi:ARM REPEAT PROTEIN INTERACTING WITH ABF2 [Camellia lanceoleosa]|uniref:ARM REPEAT PROTEIN INTERACTING WITH ABF2 n=1 Tax=Camellia lanceoleosa TaxID=1840588 RepID=A0ACC0GHS4_9ERIC|nr:ARM REPEAT PROTEIN INTERACTING WITH ABF2 [Camellia lanceoleosa]